ncbi:DUF2326 domain-containing protein [Pseudomonas sp. WS 5503]|uniref:DUF2326 domain-containing protein n=1 Tax=Pseudomonas sp. WS 5503 TaxID=2717497 RepID=UPI001474810B|nr:DUF2326 domain-containing protein [Pseudomonas sp. WS 5503]NMX79893.1 DUF2326 domain-containing protein [Pseudomonas sp. WS 5503]
MRLIRLSANHQTFKTVNFNRTGITIIVGSKTKDSKSVTYNGVGKSLIAEIIHFCLGSNKNKEFEKKIPNWIFSLEIETSTNLHKISRNTSNQAVVLLDEQEIKLASLNQWLEQHCFFIPRGVPGLSFRSLVPKFIRRGLKQYSDPRETGDYSEYDSLIRNALLLGIDVHLIALKSKIRDEINALQTLRKNFKTDPLIREFYSGGKDSDIHLSHLERKISELEKNRDEFIVAEDYYDIQQEADSLSESAEKIKNNIFILRSAIVNIDGSIKEQPDLSVERIKNLYNELLQQFKPEALKRLDEVSEFHKKLLENRISRLSQEKIRILGDLESEEKSLKSKQTDLDSKLQLLGKTRALDQYTAIVNQIADLTTQLQKLKDYNSLSIELSNKEANLELQMSEEIIKTNNYLEETKDEREGNFEVFKEYANRFYPNSPAGITLHNNEGKKNKIRFNFDVRIENDSSDGINEARIFCYDMTLLSLQENHRINFIFHDSRLYSNMDVRQRAELFRIASETTRRNDLQYIATLNPDQISGMSEDFTPEEYKSLIQDNIVLELKDDSPESKLLGIQVDMHYDR